MNELSVKFVNVLGLNPFVRNNSSARQYMFAGHIAQALVINGSTERIIQTGMEQEFGKYTFRTAMPADGRILRIIEKYPQTIGVDNIKINPLTIVIYEDITTGSIGCFSMERFKSFHQHFGFDNNPTENINQIRVGKVIPKDTVFLDSPNIKENGGYAFGLELNLALMTAPGTSEDGVIISRDVLDRMKFKVYERRSVDFGKNSYPLNIYGDATNYKIFPDIGEYIREDGLLMATRSYNEDLDPTDFNAYSVRNIDPVFDNLTYSRAGRGVVVDIKVLTNDVELGIVPENMCLQINKYLKAQKEYYTQILETEKNLRLESRRKYNQDMLQVTNELHQLIMEALIYTDGYQYKSQYPLSRLYKKKPLDDYKIEFTIEYELIPDIGYKLTDTAGGKGVICSIVEPETMPIDAAGNRADIIMDPNSTVNRMNPGRLYEQYLGAACRDIQAQIKQSILFQTDILRMDIEQLGIYILENHYNDFKIHFTTLLKFYGIVSPKQYSFYSTCPENDQIEHFCNVLKNGIYLYFPPDNPVDMPTMLKQIEANFNLVYGPVRYIGNSGIPSVTEYPIRIGPVYFMLLEKIGDDWSGMASGKLQHFGILSPVIKAEKYSYPWRNTAVRTIGETEGRLYNAYCGPKALTEMVDRSNSPMTHKNVVYNILSAPTPGNIQSVVNRAILPYGNTKPLQLMEHLFMCNGFKYVWEPEEP